MCNKLPIEIDLHGLELSEAKVEVLQKLEECVLFHEDQITIIHGYQHGSVLKAYIRSEKFLKDAQRDGYRLKPAQIMNPGSTSFNISLKK
jgi:dsDNA-specific endonuclease/ATPase MutS2